MHAEGYGRNSRKQQVNDGKDSEQQIIEDKINAKIVTDYVLSEKSMELQFHAGGLLCANHCQCENFQQGLPSLSLSELLLKSFVESIAKNNAEEMQKLYAEDDCIRNADIAQILSEETFSSESPFNYGGTTSLIRLPFISS